RCSVPISCPETRIVGEPPPEPMLQTENSSSGACGAQRCQAAITAFAFVHGHWTPKVETRETGVVLNVKSVAMPKLPPPPPRLAQKRSAFRPGEQTRAPPSAVASVSA